MEYENMRVPELKSLARDRGLRNYSQMRKAELVAFLTIWVRIIICCVGQKGLRETCMISQFVVGNKILFKQTLDYARE